MTSPKYKIFIISLLVYIFSGAPLLANQIDPTGFWQSDDGESRYEVSLCGDGTKLCAKLIWIKPDVINDRNKVYIDTFVVNQAKRFSDREWRGNISLYGYSVSGNVKAYSKDRLMVRGCALIIVCVRQGLTRMATVD